MSKDLVGVVRCDKCKFCVSNPQSETGLKCSYLRITVTRNFFCAAGKDVDE